MEAIDGTDQGPFARDGCPALGPRLASASACAHPRPKANSARRPSHSSSCPACGLWHSLTTRRSSLSTPPPAVPCPKAVGPGLALWAVDAHKLQAAYQNRCRMCLSAVYCCLRGLSHLGSNLDTVQALQSRFGKSTFPDGPWGARGMMGEMPTGRSQCGSILSGTTAIPLMHSRRISTISKPRGKLLQCDAGTDPSESLFLGRRTRHGDHGLCYCHCCIPSVCLCVCVSVCKRQRACVCVCVCAHHPAWQTRRTRNASPFPPPGKSVVDVGKGGPGWNSMAYYACHSSLIPNSLRIACCKLRYTAP